VDMGTLLLISMAIVGAALIAGGIVAYRVSKATLGKALGAAAIAGGAMMIVVVTMSLPVTRTSSGPLQVESFETSSEPVK